MQPLVSDRSCAPGLLRILSRSRFSSREALQSVPLWIRRDPGCFPCSPPARVFIGAYIERLGGNAPATGSRMFSTPIPSLQAEYDTSTARSMSSTMIHVYLTIEERAVQKQKTTFQIPVILGRWSLAKLHTRRQYDEFVRMCLS